MPSFSSDPLLYGVALAVLLVMLGGPVRHVLRTPERKAALRARRLRVYLENIIMMWGLAALCLWAWAASGREAVDLGLTIRADWVNLAAWLFVAVIVGQQLVQAIVTARSVEARRQLREQIARSGDLSMLQPETVPQFRVFFLLAVTAGITEEIIFRAFLINVFALSMPLWAAGLLALVLFVGVHAYQGMAGLLRILPISAVLTGMCLVTGSQWPGIVLHAAVDIFGGIFLWMSRPEAIAKVSIEAEQASLS